MLVPQYISSRNDNGIEPNETIYPRRDSGDPSYTISEDRLRGAIYIPQTYTYGTKLPVILCPGTATPAGISYRFNLFRLLAASDYADPVLLNVPGTTVHDIQVTAEYYAYAIHYISATGGRQGSLSIAIIAQSQGCVNTQWTLKYWPSTRKVVSNFIAISGAFSGTTVYSEHRSLLERLAGAPALMQQDSGSTFISTLREDNGDSAYVPTTSIYSAEDKLVRPQAGEQASGKISDYREIGVTNAEIQIHCPKNTKAGRSVSHVGVIYSSFTYALLQDALTHRDAGDVMRLDLEEVHKRKAAPTVGFLDIMLTRIGDLVSIVYLLKFRPKSKREPAIVAYATSSQ